MTSSWSIEALELDRYLQSVEVERESPSVEALGRLQLAHARRFSFDNIDVLLRSHPGVQLDQVQEKFLGRGRGGYCYEHMTLLAAVMQALGYPVERHLGRVQDVNTARTHLSVVTKLDGRRWMVDAGFGFSAPGPVLLEDGFETDSGGWQWRMDALGDGSTRQWRLSRASENSWTMMHVTDELPVTPADIQVAHHFHSTSPESVFCKELRLMRHFPDRHVAIIGPRVTTRRPGRPTEQHQLADGELRSLLPELTNGLTPAEIEELVSRCG